MTKPLQQEEKERRFAARFWALAEKTKTCWLWTGATSPEGYGNINRLMPDGRPAQKAHRYAYSIAKGAIPPGMVIDHLCRVRRCVNPDHLEVVTPFTNTFRGETTVVFKHRSKTSCINGHPFAPGNIITNAHGHRRCRACRDANNAKWNALRGVA